MCSPVLLLGFVLTLKNKGSPFFPFLSFQTHTFMLFCLDVTHLDLPQLRQLTIAVPFLKHSEFLRNMFSGDGLMVGLDNLSGPFQP